MNRQFNGNVHHREIGLETAPYQHSDHQVNCSVEATTKRYFIRLAKKEGISVSEAIGRELDMIARRRDRRLKR